jgi:hypothetical protein
MGRDTNRRRREVTEIVATRPDFTGTAQDLPRR